MVKYKRGYVPGVFDLFHLGHLNLLKNSKERCEYLIVGVLTDELVEHFKGKRPVISFEERKAIIEAIKYVDEVVPVTFENTRKIDAWHQLHYDCHFSGNDHGPDWEYDLRQLQEVGSTMEFLNYTKGISSSSLKSQMGVSAEKGKLLMFGAGIYGRRFLKYLRETSQIEQWNVVGFLDNNPEKNHMMVDGVKIYSMDELPLIVPDGLYTVAVTVKEPEKIVTQLSEAGILNVLKYYDFPNWESFMEKENQIAQNEYLLGQLKRREQQLECTYNWLAVKEAEQKLLPYFERRHCKKIAIYGIAEFGQLLFKELENTEGMEVVGFIDRTANEKRKCCGLSVYSPEESLQMPETDMIVVTAIVAFEKIANNMAKLRPEVPVVSLETIIEECNLEDENEYR